MTGVENLTYVFPGRRYNYGMRGAWVKVLGMLLLLFVGALPGAKGQQYSRLQTSAPLSVEYENYLMAEGWLGVGEVEKLSDPRSFFNGIMPGSERADEIADTLGVRMRILDVTTGGSVRSEDLAKVEAELASIFGTLPENRYNVKSIALCASAHAIAPPLSPSLSGTLDSVGMTLRDRFAAWIDLVQTHQPLAQVLGEGGSLDVVVVDADSSVVGFSSAVEATVPGASAVVIPYNVFVGAVEARDRSKVLAHLIANRLGLKPLWYDAPGGDFVDDTPRQLLPNYGSAEGKTYVSMAEGMPVELADNVMDNTFDEGGRAWTGGQVDFLLAALTSPDLKLAFLTEGCKESKFEEDEPVVESLTMAVAPPSVALSARPNPARESVTVSWTVEDQELAGGRAVSIEITDQVGRVMHRWDDVGTGSATERLSIEGWPSGWYTLRMTSGNPGFVGMTRQFVKVD